jgi:hypothetical protein
MATLTTNTNFLSPVEFQLVLNRLPNVQFFIQGANVPGISSSGTERPSPFKTINEPSDKITYDDFSVTVLCDEDMVAFREVSDWLVALTYPDNFQQYATLTPAPNGDGKKSDGSLVVLNSNKNANVTIKFTDLFPVSVSGLQLNTAESDLTPPTFEITFKYSNYTIEV